jgi:hypothetical protein
MTKLDWKSEIRENVDYDEAELGCNWDLETLIDFIDSLLTQQREDQTKKIGMLRQWLNESRIKDPDKFFTNEQLLEWLK